MVIGTIANDPGGLVIGLSFENLSRLAKGQPIDRNIDVPGLKGRLIIMAAPHEEMIVSFLRDAGWIPRDREGIPLDGSKGA